MSEPDEILFECIRCGAMNPAIAKSCAVCGHRFGGTDVILPVPVSTVIKSTKNPYEPPTARIAPPRTIRISSILMLIAEIAVCLGAYRSAPLLGIFLSLSLLPASIRTPTVSMRFRDQGRAMSPGDLVLSFIVTVLATWVVALSSGIAFFITCIPTSLLGQNIYFAVGAGLLGAIAWAVWLTGLFLRLAREQRARELEIRYP